MECMHTSMCVCVRARGFRAGVESNAAQDGKARKRLRIIRHTRLRVMHSRRSASPDTEAKNSMAAHLL